MKDIKKLALLLFLAVITTSAMTQTKPKPKQQEAVPTQKEMEEMMKEAQKEMENLNPEIKRMMDSLGVKMPSFNSIPDVTDQQLAAAAAEEDWIIPTKKTNLIAQLPKKILTNAELVSYIKTTNTSIANIITPKSKELGDKTMLQFKNDPYYGAMIASTANGMWMMGLQEPAVYLMGKAVEVLPNADNYNNYAAYLTMLGGGHTAIPILEKLNQIHKKNSTVLNNLGQAWLQLGDANNANKYLDSAILIYAHHPQANYTKCLILESEGKTAEAIHSVKRSLEHSVTKNKLDKLKKLEKNQRPQPKYYVPRTYFSMSFNLAIYTAVLPTSYSKGLGLEIQKQWDDARQQLNDELEGLNAAIRMADKQANEELKQIQNKSTGHRIVGFSPYYYKALNQIPPSSLTDEIKFERETREDYEYLLQIATLRSEFANAREQYYEEQNTNDCGEVPIVIKYISTMNTLNQTYRDAKVTSWATDAYSNYNYATSVAPTAGVALRNALEIKRDFLRKLIGLNHESYNLPGCASKEEETKKWVKRKLPDYDKVNCKTESKLYVPMTGLITVKCNVMIVDFNPHYLPFKAKWTEDFNADRIVEASVSATIKAIDITLEGKRDENGDFESGKIRVGKEVDGLGELSVGTGFDPNGFTKGSVELGLDESMSLLPKSITDAAPIDISLKGKLGVGMELGADGILDFYVKDEVKLDVSSAIKADFAKDGEETKGLINEIANGADVELKAPKIATGASISADSRVSINGGYSENVSGKFSKLGLK